MGPNILLFGGKNFKKMNAIIIAKLDIGLWEELTQLRDLH